MPVGGFAWPVDMPARDPGFVQKFRGQFLRRDKKHLIPPALLFANRKSTSRAERNFLRAQPQAREKPFRPQTCLIAVSASSLGKRGFFFFMFFCFCRTEKRKGFADARTSGGEHPRRKESAAH